MGHRDTVEIVEERRQFSIDDLPLNVLDLKKSGEKAREFYSLLIGDNEDLKKATVDWLNLHLDEAITQVLNLGREDLQRLMREVRESLAEQDTELVLLIEDFAKLQGIDRELLEAVLARPQQPGRKPLCSIRTALACTTGYFKSLIDTVQQRVTFSVNLDIGAVGNQSLINQTDIQEFVARYLNAVRLEDKTILNWANYNQQKEDLQIESLESACIDCEHRAACHAGFTSVNEMGLYPFTPTALKQMQRRVNTGNFNPRIIIKDILKYTLETGINDINKGHFPSVSLYEHFGGKELSTKVQSDIRAKDPQNIERRETLIDLWTDSDQICDLPAEVHTAFNLPALDIQRYSTDNTKIIPVRGYKLITRNEELVIEESNEYKTEKKSVNHDLELPIPDALVEKLKILDGWNNQKILPQNLGQDLRVLLFPAIVQRIEWDNNMLLEKTFATKTANKYFKQQNIVFHSPKVTRETIAGIKLSLPLNSNDSEFLETAIAFQGILLYSHHKHWKFTEGDRYFRAYSKQLERWSQYVLEQIRLYPRESGEAWDPVPAAVELLAISATMAGHSTNTLESLINALFLEVDKNAHLTRASSWKKLSETFNNSRQDLLEIVLSRIACTKGSSPRVQIIDAIQIIKPLEQVRKSWRPQCEIPDDIREKFTENSSGKNSEFSKLCKTRQQVDVLLEKAIQEERDHYLTFYEYVVAELGEDIKKQELIDTLKQSIEKAREAVVFRGRNYEDTIKLLDAFRRTGISNFMQRMKLIQEKDSSETTTGKLLQYLSEDYQKLITDTTEFISNTNKFLDASLLEAQNSIKQLEISGGVTLEFSQKVIQGDLAKLRSLMCEIKEGTICS